MIIRGGENIYPIEIEDVLIENGRVASVAVVGVADDHWGEVVHAFVVPNGSDGIDVDELKRESGRRLAAYKVPEEIHVVDELPMNASGKILRRVLRDLV